MGTDPGKVVVQVWVMVQRDSGGDDPGKVVVQVWVMVQRDSGD